MDYSITYYLNHLWAGTYIDNISGLISSRLFLAILWSVTVVMILVFDKKHGKKIFWRILITFLLYYLVVEILMKNIFANYFFELRPYLTHPADIIPIGKLSSDSSFPSGHMASTLSILTVLIYYYQKYWVWALAFLILMAFSRIHNGMHYPFDVLAGIFIGLLCGLFAIYIVDRITGKNKV